MRLVILKDIAAMANAGGCYFIVGISEQSSRANVFARLSHKEATSIRTAIVDWTIQHIRERIFGIESDIREVEPGNNIVIRKSMRAMVSHDLRTPLSSIILNMQMVLDRKASSLPEDVNRILRRVYSESQRLHRLSNTLLDIEKIEDGKLEVKAEVVSCADLVHTSISVVRPQCERKQIEITEDLDSAETKMLCYCDKDRTIQVLVNFLSNACKFAPVNSRIEVRAQTLETKDRVRFEVLDSGPGIPEEQAARLFNKFSQLNQPLELKQQGSGLGLYICKMLITAQEGEVGYEPRPAGGSCSWFELPAVIS